MSVQSEIQRLTEAREEIAEAIRDQDVTVPSGTVLAGMPALIRAIVGKVKTVCGVAPGSDGNISLTASNIKAAPTSHASTAATYGLGSAEKYGHVMLSDGIGDPDYNASKGMAVTPRALWLVSTQDFEWQIQIPATIWQGSGPYTATVEGLEEMYADTKVSEILLESSLVGNAAAEQAAAQWNYLDTGAGKVTLYANVKPTADFALILRRFRTWQPTGG